MKKHLLGLQLALVFLFGLVVQGQETDKLDRFFKRKMNKAGIAGLQAGYVSKGQLQWVGSYGTQNYASGEKMNDSTLFLIASCSKPVTALGIMKLFDKGIIKLDDDINLYLPFSIRNPNHPFTSITIRMLLSHTSSIIDNMELLVSLYTFDKGGDSDISLESFIQRYFESDGAYYDETANFAKEEPGTVRNYSNAGYALLGYLIQEISGQPFHTYMAQNIFAPLQMDEAYWFLREIPHNNVSMPHEFMDNKIKSFKVLKHYGFPDYPDGQLRTNVTNYAEITKLMLNKGAVNGQPFLIESTVNEFLRIQFPKADKWQAIGWNNNEFNNWLYYLLMPRLPSHTGVDPGVATVVSFDPKKGVGAIIFANTLKHDFKGHKALYVDMVKRLLKQAKKH
jgi:CubicO group peptidase (beta-lactamase class C family)